MSPYRYGVVQSCLILTGGCCGAIAVAILPTIGAVTLIVFTFLFCALLHYVCYHPGGRAWRRAINVYFAGFLLLSGSPPRAGPGNSSKRSELVHKEAQKLIQLIVRDFVVSWYHQISENQEFPRETVCLLEHLANDLQTRLATVDTRSLLLSLLPLLDPYLTALNEVGYVNERGKSTFDVTHTYCLMLFEKKPHLVHPALKNNQTELEHIQRLVDTFICSSAIPSHYKQSDIAIQFIREVLVYRVFHPLFNLICEPEFLLHCIPLLLAKASDEKIRNIMSRIEAENKILDHELSQQTGLLTPFSKAPPPPPIPTSLSDTVQYRNSYPYRGGDHQIAQSLRNDAASNGELGGGYVDASIEESVYVNLPPIYIDKHVRVDTRDGVHTGYIIKFPSKMLDSDQLSSIRSEAEGELESLKRYREFVQLHKSLSNSSSSYLVKGFSLPDRRIMSHIWNKTPFSSGEPDPTTILERKEGLEEYLHSVVAIKEVRESELFKEFLFTGVTSLQEAEVFSTRPRYGKGRRDWRKSIALEKTTVQSEQLFSDVLVSFSENNYLPISHQRGGGGGGGGGVHSNFTDHQSETDHSPPPPPSPPPSITPQGILQLIPTAVWSLFSQGEGGRGGRGMNDDHMCLAAEREESSPLINSLLSLANEATRTTSPELWVTSEGTQLALLGLCGETLDAYLMKELLEVVNDETRWARALYSLRHLLWPDGGNLSVSTSPTLSDEEKLSQRRQAIEEIKNFLPNALPWLVGNSTYNDTIEHCLNCIQNPRINRHFLFRAIDILFLQVVPELKDREFQERLVKMRTRPSFLSAS